MPDNIDGCLLEILLAVGAIAALCADSVLELVAGGLLVLAAIAGHWASSRGT